jgi:hypothetical protein
MNAIALSGIPPEALHIEISEYSPNSCTTLRSYCRPVEGGLILARDGDTPGTGCTMGFHASWNGQEVFLTASHCSPTFFSTDYNFYYRHVPINDSVHYVGREHYDPPGSWCSWWQFWTECRYSDAAIVMTGPFVSTNRGFIARTSGPNLGGVNSITIDPNKPRFRITDRWNYQWVYEGAIINMVGQRSGWRQGVITDFCLDVLSPQGPVLKCQVRTSYTSQPGDSGAPVFGQPTPSGDVRLVGLHHGDINGFGVFSTLWGITQDLGHVNVYAPGWSPPGGGGGGCSDPWIIC